MADMEDNGWVSSISRDIFQLMMAGPLHLHRAWVRARFQAPQAWRRVPGSASLDHPSCRVACVCSVVFMHGKHCRQVHAEAIPVPHFVPTLEPLVGEASSMCQTATLVMTSAGKVSLYGPDHLSACQPHVE